MCFFLSLTVDPKAATWFSKSVATFLFRPLVGEGFFF